jgi:hypothetical protein
MIKIMSINEFSSCESCDNNMYVGANPDDSELNIDDALLDELVELVGSEEEVEMAASAAHDDLMAAFEKNEVELSEDSVPEKLAISALIIKLVELGKLGPEEADQLIADHLG